jgi:hypothetical protein
MARSPGRLLRPALVTLCLAVLAAPAGAQGGKTKDDRKQDQAEINRFLKQLLAKFDAWDRDDDNVLDKQELARAFRGPKAKPFDANMPKLPPPKIVLLPGKPVVRPISAVLVTVPPWPVMAFNYTIAELLTAGEPVRVAVAAPLPPPPNVTGFPDYQFLLIAGTGGKTSVSRQEFEKWGRAYARLAHEREEAEDEIKQARDRLRKAKNPKAKQQAQADLARRENDLSQIRARLGAIPQAVRDALPLKR